MKLAVFRLETTNPISYKQIAIMTLETLQDILVRYTEPSCFTSDNLGELED